MRAFYFLIRDSGISSSAYSIQFTKFIWFYTEVLIQQDIGYPPGDFVNKWWFVGADVHFQLAVHIVSYRQKRAVIVDLIILNLWSVHWHFNKCQRIADECDQVWGCQAGCGEMQQSRARRSTRKTLLPLSLFLPLHFVAPSSQGNRNVDEQNSSSALSKSTRWWAWWEEKPLSLCEHCLGSSL